MEEELFQTIAEHLKPLSKEVVTYLDDTFSSERNIICGYHPYMQGVFGQTILNRVANNYGLADPKSYYISFETSQMFNRIVRDEKPDEVILLNFDPRSNKIDFMDDVERVSLFGQQSLEKHINELQAIEDLRYFNPNMFVPSTINHKKIKDGEVIEYEYIRGVPMFVPLSMAAEELGVDTSFLAAYGLRNSGFWDLAGSFEKLKEIECDQKKVRQTSTSLSLFLSYDLRDSREAIKILSRIKGYDDDRLRMFHSNCLQKNLYSASKYMAGYALRNSETLETVKIMPIKKGGFEQLNGLIGNLENGRKMRYGSDIRAYIDVTDPDMRKVSLRSTQKINLLEILNRAFGERDPRDPDVAGINFGGQRMSAGFSCNTGQCPGLMKDFLNAYLQEDFYNEEDLAFLNDFE